MSSNINDIGFQKPIQTPSTQSPKSETSMSLARRNSIAFTDFMKPKKNSVSEEKDKVNISDLSKLMSKIDELKEKHSQKEGLITSVSQKEGGPKVRTLDIFSPEFDASNLSENERNMLRTASYFENIDFNFLKASDFKKFEEINKALNSVDIKSEDKQDDIFKILGDKGLLV